MTMLFLLVLFVILGGLVAYLFWSIGSREEKAQARLQAAWNDYQQALAALKAAPTNPDLKQQTLALGRQFSALSRDNKRVTMFDEVALSNDINAATAAAVRVASSAPATITPTPAASIEERLRQLDSLRTKGLITDAEYTQRRQQLIESV